MFRPTKFCDLRAANHAMRYRALKQIPGEGRGGEGRINVEDKQAATMIQNIGLFLIQRPEPNRRIGVLCKAGRLEIGEIPPTQRSPIFLILNPGRCPPSISGEPAGGNPVWNIGSPQALQTNVFAFFGQGTTRAQMPDFTQTHPDCSLIVVGISNTYGFTGIFAVWRLFQNPSRSSRLDNRITWI